MRDPKKKAGYTYTKLKDCKAGTDDHYHFYAVVLDAQYPHKSFKSERFMLTLRIAEPDSEFDFEGVVTTSTLVMFAKRFEDLPIVQRVGDIIRVHRAFCGLYKGAKQFTCNIFFNSSWALFSHLTAKDRLKVEGVEADKAMDFHPFAYFGNKFSFEKSEQKVITRCRDWVGKSFAENPVLSSRYITKLKDVPEEGKKRENGKYYDFDLHVRVAQVFKLDDYSSEARVIDDSNEVWFFQYLHMKYRYLREGQYIHIRSATLEHHEKYSEGRVFGLKNHSNILSLPFNCHIARNLKFDLKKQSHDLDA